MQVQNYCSAQLDLLQAALHGQRENVFFIILIEGQTVIAAYLSKERVQLLAAQAVQNQVVADPSDRCSQWIYALYSALIKEEHVCRDHLWLVEGAQ